MKKHYALAASLGNGLSPEAGMSLGSPSPWGSRETSRRRRDDWHYSRLGVWSASLALSFLAWYWILRSAIDLLHLVIRLFS